MDINLTYAKIEYDLMITKLDLTQSKEVILNGNLDNAQSLFYRLISGADKTINIISTQLELYDTQDIVDALKNAVIRGVQVKILLDGSDINKDNSFLKVCASNKEQCTIKTSEDKMNYHILTRDSVAYRYCQHTEDHRAIASFNDSEIAEKVDKKIFSEENYSTYQAY